MKYFNEITTIIEMRAQFRQWCLKLHPDKGGDPEEFKAMKDEYDSIIKRMSLNEALSAKSENRRTAYTYEREKQVMNAIERFMRIPGIIVELCGSWLWLSGNTFPVHDRIKAEGAKFSSSKKKWYYSPYMSERKPKKSMYSMQKIREKFGSEIFENENNLKCIAA